MINKFYRNKKNKALISHGRCADGFGAAWSVWRKYGDSIDYYYATHNDQPIDLTGKTILFTDFAYQRSVMEELSKKNDVLVIDHHIDAARDLNGLDNVFFDMKKSGAVLAWENTFPDEPIPLLLKYVQDRDLVKYQLPYSLEILSVLDTIPRDFESWSYFAEELEYNFPDVLLEGIELRKKFEDRLQKIIESPTEVYLNGIKGLIVHAEEFDFASFAAESLSENANFGMSWFREENGKIKCSIRSKNKNINANDLARTIGGGGHEYSAGATIHEDHLEEILKTSRVREMHLSQPKKIMGKLRF